MGGNWKSTNPKAEQEAMKKKNDSSNGLLQATCRHFRYIRDRYYSSYHLSGIVIDSFVYVAMGNWKYLEPGESGTASAGDYERLLKDYLDRNTIWGNLNLTVWKRLLIKYLVSKEGKLWIMSNIEINFAYRFEKHMEELFILIQLI